MRRFCTAVAFSSLIVVLLSSLCQAKPPNWLEVRSPNFIVVSNAGEKQARKAAVQFEQIRAVFRQAIAIASAGPSPVITVLAVKDETSMRELLPEYWAKGHSHPSGFFASLQNQFYAAVQLDAQGTNPYENFYHEYYHTISVPYVPNLPLWLAEGLAEFFGHTNIEEKSVIIGNDDPILLAELRNSSLIPLTTLFQVDRTSPYYNEANKTSIFYAESWVLTHYLIIGDRVTHKPMPMLLAYLDALNYGKNANEAATTAFGDFKKLQSDLQNYIHNSNYYHFTLPTPQFGQQQLQLRNLSEAETEAYRGGFAVVRGRSQEATAILDQALRMDPNVALAHQNLAFADFLQGQRGKALESVSKAIALDPRNSFTRYLRAFLETSGSGLGSDAPQIEDDLRQAIAISPDFAPPYGLLAVHLAAENQKLDEALAFAQKAISFEPANSNYQLALAQVLIRQNKFNEAGLAARRASAWARDPAEKATADNFRQFLARFRQLQTELASADGAQPQTLSPQNDAVNSPPDDDDPGMPKLRVRGNAPPDAASPNPFTATILRVQSSLTLIGDPMGVDFSPYLKDLMEAIRKNLMSSVSKLRVSQPKDVTVELAVSKDGTISGMKIASSSGNEALDRATQDGITSSAPLPTLPAAFKGQSLKLRLRFSYSEQSN
ncbi:MAG TPA: TonB family protein [Terriglobales bacterium]|nr:TonB family protein [Terriglobales bacterium]